MLYAGIDADLSLWSHGIDKQTTDAALRRWREQGVLCSIMILNGMILHKIEPEPEHNPNPHPNPHCNPSPSPKLSPGPYP